MSIDKIKHTAFVYSEGRGCTHNHTRVWVIRKYHCQTTFMISRITTHTHSEDGYSLCLFCESQTVWAVMSDTLISPADDFLALLSVFSVKTFPFPLRHAACYRSQCELRAASTKLHWRIDIWSDIKSSKIPSIRIGLRHSACYPDTAEEVKVKHVEKAQRKNTVGGNQSTRRKPTKRNSCRKGDSNRRPSCCEVTVPLPFWQKNITMMSLWHVSLLYTVYELKPLQGASAITSVNLTHSSSPSL